MAHHILHPFRNAQGTRLQGTNGAEVIVSSSASSTVIGLRDDPWSHPAWAAPGERALVTARGRRARFAQRYGMPTVS